MNLRVLISAYMSYKFFQGRTESISRLSVELTEEDSDVAWGEESNLQTKNNGEHDGCAICMLGGKLLLVI